MTNETECDIIVRMGDTVLVAMSGGVDSSYAAAHLQRLGYQVQGVYMKLWGGTRRGSSCSTADHQAAQLAADHLGIQLHTVDWTVQFERLVIAPFVRAAARAEIGNPCISCNRQFKIQGLVQVANQLDIHWIASGHYARVVHGGDHPGLHRATDAIKDQSYVMWALQPAILERLLLPNGHLHKKDIRNQAQAWGLPAADTPDSMELCFDPKQVVRDALGMRPGKVTDMQDQELGHLDDLSMVAIGQRRGLPEVISGGPERRYVVRVEPQHQRVVIGSAHDLMVDRIHMEDWIFTQRCSLDQPMALQTSAHGRSEVGYLTIDGDRATFVLEQPTRRPTPGQFGVVYEGDRVIGAGVMKNHDAAV